MKAKRLIDLPSLHKNQQKVFDHFERSSDNLVVSAGRRFGKTRLALTIAIDYCMNFGKRVWWIAPTYKISERQFRQLKRMIGENYTYKSEQGRRIEFHFKGADGNVRYGEIEFKSADRDDNLRGEGLDLVIFDEAAFIRKSVFDVIRPALVDRKGRFILISTPYGFNWFHGKYVHGLSAGTGWKSFHFTSYDNPILDAAEIEKSKLDLTELQFRQEHLAEFIDDIGRVFNSVHQRATVEMRTIPTPGHVYVIGVDLGRKDDATVFSIIDLTAKQQVYIDILKSVSWDMQRVKLKNLSDLWRPVRILIEENSGSSFIEDLQKLIPNVEPFYTSSKTKPAMIDSLALALEKGDLFILNDNTPYGAVQIQELKAYEMRKARTGLGWQYGAPNGMHDDTVMALALAWWTCRSSTTIVQFVSTNPFYVLNKPKIDERPRLMTEFQKNKIAARKKIKELIDNGDV